MKDFFSFKHRSSININMIEATITFFTTLNEIFRKYVQCIPNANYWFGHFTYQLGFFFRQKIEGNSLF